MERKGYPYPRKAGYQKKMILYKQLMTELYSWEHRKLGQYKIINKYTSSNIRCDNIVRVYQYNLKSINRKVILMSLITYAQFQAKYRFQGQINQGSFGRVFKIKEIASKKSFALKKLTVKKQQQLKDTKNQINILTNFKYPLVVSLYEYYNIQIGDNKRNCSQEFGLVMELAIGSLQQLIKSRRKIGSIQTIFLKLFRLVQLLAQFQTLNIAHRDIKPANILIFEGNDSDTIWKLADFGLAINLNDGENQTIAGSYDYVSPMLKRKFNFRKLNIKTNPFKDDVYSLGITIIQIFTGQRKYNEQVKVHIEEVLCDSKLVKLINLMLDTEESRRPCFRELLEIIRHDFDYHSSKINNEAQNLKQISNKTRKKCYNFGKEEDLEFYRKNSPNVKTICKKDHKDPHLTMINLQKRKVTCITNLDGRLMCGCQGGDIIFINNHESQQIVEIREGPVHKKYVSQFCQDKNENIWSIGGDGCIIKWKKFGLLKALMNDVIEEKTITKSIFYKEKVQIRRVIFNSDAISKRIKILDRREVGATSLMAIDEEQYCVGFSDGSIYIHWNWTEFHIRAHTHPIVNIKCNYDNSTLFTCSTNGEVKSIDLKTMDLHHRFYYCNSFTTSLQIIDRGEYETLCMSCQNGSLIYINKDLQEIYRTKTGIQQIMLSKEFMQNHYILSESGIIYDNKNDREIINLGEKSGVRAGWNCLNMITENQIAIGSFQESIAFVSI